LVDKLRVILQCAGVHPSGRLDRAQPIEKSFRVRRDSRRRGDRAQVGVGEEIGGERAKTGPNRRRGGRTDACADDGEGLGVGGWRLHL
jgi:hypothetical protein